MKHQGLRFTPRYQRGFTLIELLIAIAIAGVITGVITVAVMQILSVNHRASNHMIAVRQVQQAGKEVSIDTLQTQPSNVDDNPADGAFLVLSWTDWEGANNTVVYTLQPMPSSPGLTMLERIHTINGTEEVTAPLVVAQYIDPDPAQTSCYWDAGKKVLIFKVTAAVGDQTETRIYEADPRPT